MNRRAFLEAFCATVFAGKLGLAETHGIHVMNGGCSSPDGLTGPSTAACKSSTALVPIPVSVKGVREPVIDLGGSWKVASNPPDGFWRQNIDLSSWTNVDVPGEFATQGLQVVQNVEYPCRKSAKVPPDFTGQRLFLRFDGVYGYARVWVNGVYIRDHFGGFTSWDCEITGHVKPDRVMDLVVGITDRSDDISQASYYAKHSVAGILRGVRLIVVPPIHLNHYLVSATLDTEYENGAIHITAASSSQNYKTAQLELKLMDKLGKNAALDPSVIPLTAGSAVSEKTLAIRRPERWDAEHPNLYTFETSVVVDGQLVEILQRKIGFRTVERKANRVLVNGQPVKLRGACRHSIHPVYGRAVPPDLDERDAVLFREANINFVRTSHYPPAETFLDACDRHGIYVEEETAVCWSKVDGGPSSDPEFTGRFLSQFQEMIERDREHPAILFWSLGNESEWGANFAVEHEFAREHDPSRPVIFSYPDTAPWGTNAYDIYSKHYADVDSDLGSEFRPVLNDEYAHIPCYNVDTLRRDPGVRNFWGESIKRFGESFLSFDGCLGGSIWAGIDEVFLLPQGPAGYGPWGVIDGWRRPKPEHWLAKKAYSPIRIDDKELAIPSNENELQIPIYNAFDHTNFKELDIRWSIGGKSGRVTNLDIPPHCPGYLAIPAQKWASGDPLDLQFRVNDLLIDHFRLPVGPPRRPASGPTGGRVQVSNTRSEVLIEGADFSIAVSPATGQIERATCGGQVILEGGPFLDLGSGFLEGWLLRSFESSGSEDIVTIRCSGEYGGIDTTKIDFEMEVNGSGLITTRYRTSASPLKADKIGLAYLLPTNVDTLTWDRKSLWSVYPEDHIGRPQGTAPRVSAHAAQRYRTKPEWPWSQDMGDFFLFGKDAPQLSASNDFRALKEHVWRASCILSGGKVCARVEALADVAVRASPLPDSRILLSVYNFWTYPDLAWGNYLGAREMPAQTTHEIKLRLLKTIGK